MRDLEEIVAHVAVDAPAAAERLFTSIRAKAASLSSHPHRGRIVPELLEFGTRTWRELVVRPYRLVYRVTRRRVFVLAVFDGRRNLEDLLLERLLREP